MKPLSPYKAYKAVQAKHERKLRRDHVDAQRAISVADEEEEEETKQPQIEEMDVQAQYPELIKAASESVVMLGEQRITKWSGLVQSNGAGTPVHELPPIWERGVSLSLLCWWAVNVADKDASTASVAAQLRSETAEVKGSSYGLVKALRVSSGSTEATGKPNATGTPVAFISHAHSSKLFDTIEALCEWCLKKGSRLVDCYVWFDLFSCDLRKSDEKDARKVGDVSQVISYIGHTLVLGLFGRPDLSTDGQKEDDDEESRPQPALTRLWVLYEALLTIIAGAKLQYILLPHVEAFVRRRFRTNFAEQLEDVCAISCDDAHTHVAADSGIIRSRISLLVKWVLV